MCEAFRKEIYLHFLAEMNLLQLFLVNINIYMFLVHVDTIAYFL